MRGIPEVQRNLAEFPKLLVMGAFAKALSRAAAVFETELRAVTPEAEYPSTSTEKYGHLIDALTHEIEIDTSGRGGRVRIGYGRKAMVALWVEYGHRIVRDGRLDKKGRGPGREVGFARAHPFMRPAFEAAAEAALDAFTQAIQEFMGSNNIDLKVAA